MLKKDNQNNQEAKTDKGKLTNEIKGVKEMLEHHEKNKTKFKIIIMTIFSIGAIFLICLWLSAPKITEEERSSIMKIPKGPQDLANILKVVERYNKDNQGWVTSIWMGLYIL